MQNNQQNQQNQDLFNPNLQNQQIFQINDQNIIYQPTQQNNKNTSHISQLLTQSKKQKIGYNDEKTQDQDEIEIEYDQDVQKQIKVQMVYKKELVQREIRYKERNQTLNKRRLGYNNINMSQSQFSDQKSKQMKLEISDDYENYNNNKKNVAFRGVCQIDSDQKNQNHDQQIQNQNYTQNQELLSNTDAQMKCQKILDQLHFDLTQNFQFDCLIKSLTEYRQFTDTYDNDNIQNYKHADILAQKFSIIITQSCLVDMTQLNDEQNQLLVLNLYAVHNVVQESQNTQYIIPNIQNLIKIFINTPSLEARCLSINVLANIITDDPIYNYKITKILQEESIIQKLQFFVTYLYNLDSKNFNLNKQLKQIGINGALRLIFNYFINLRLEFQNEKQSHSAIELLQFLNEKSFNKLDYMLNQEGREQFFSCLSIILEKQNNDFITLIYPEIEEIFINIFAFLVSEKDSDDDEQDDETLGEFKTYTLKQQKNILFDVNRTLQYILEANESQIENLLDSGLFDIIQLLFEIDETDNNCICKAAALLETSVRGMNVNVISRVLLTPELGDNYYFTKKIFQYMNSQYKNIRYLMLQTLQRCLYVCSFHNQQVFIISGIIQKLVEGIQNCQYQLTPDEIILTIQSITRTLSNQTHNQVGINSFDNCNGYQIFENLLNNNDLSDKLMDEINNFLNYYKIKKQESQQEQQQ